jgi:hypothetical protein
LKQEASSPTWRLLGGGSTLRIAKGNGKRTSATAGSVEGFSYLPGMAGLTPSVNLIACFNLAEEEDVIETERLLLREWRDADRPSIAGINAHPEVMRFLGEPLPRERSDAAIDRPPLSGPV